MKWVVIAAFIIFIIACTPQVEEEKIEEKTNLEVDTMKLTSSAFEHNKDIPSEYTCDGEGISPPLTISGVPDNAKSLALIMDDPDAPVGTWDHWVVFNIPLNTKEIPKNQEPEGTAGKNSWSRLGYGGPCPPSGTHRYFFKLYALDTELELPEGSSKADLERAMQGNILAEAGLMGKYKRG